MDKENETLFLERLEEINPKYVVISVYEPAFTPQWAYSFPQKYSQLLKPVQAYLDQNQNPILVIYEYNGSGQKS